MDKRAVVLLSGGIDSTTCLADAVQTYGADKVLALSMYYGQKHQKEIESAQAVAKYYGVDHIIQEISGAFDLSDCTLLQGRAEVAHESYAQQLKDMEEKVLLQHMYLSAMDCSFRMPLQLLRVYMRALCTTGRMQMMLLEELILIALLSLKRRWIVQFMKVLGVL